MDTAKILKLVGGASAAAFVAYCFYFDYKRRNAPDYQEKVKQKRTQEQQKKQQAVNTINDPEAMKQFFTMSMAKGQELRDSQPQEAAKHFANAV